jgi:putative addiction module component (TIGR02574 family)
MDSKSIIKDALNLSPAEKLYIIEILTESLSEPDKKIENYWKEEVEQRYSAYTKGEIKSIPYNDIRKNED